MSWKKQSVGCFLFLTVEAILFCLLLTQGGYVRVVASISSIILCFLFAVVHLRPDNWPLVLGLALTVGADFCLVVCVPIRQLAGMCFFLPAQLCYALALYRTDPSKKLLLVRCSLSLVAALATVVVLGHKADLLALISIVYYANLICNGIAAFRQRKRFSLLAIGFLLFMLCDAVIGLQVACGGYLNIGQDSLLYKILFMDFHLSWFFYLPSQVLIALTAGNSKAIK